MTAPLNSKRRLQSASIVAISVFILLVLRYGYLQLLNHNNLLEQAVNNYTKVVATPPNRGIIVDSQGTVLVNNNLSYALVLLAKDLNSINIPNNQEQNNHRKQHSNTTNDIINQLFNQLSKFINLTDIDKKKFAVQLANAKNYDWLTLKEGLNDTEIANLTAYGYLFPQLQVFAHTKRYYPFAGLYSHSIGYVGRISFSDKQKLANSAKEDYLPNDYIGKNGLELYYESYLRGKIGKKTIQTDALGNEVNLINNTPAIDGYTLELTLNHQLQQLANSLLGNNNGAIVALDAQNGGILAFVSKPNFDPNWFIDGISTDDWSDLVNNSNKPLLNRVTQSAYPPGSTFKPFLALASLYYNIRRVSEKFFDKGYLTLPNSTHRFRDNDHPQGLGNIDMLKAISISSDTYFYKLALDLGIARIDEFMSYFGFGHKTGIDLPHEALGILPSPTWKAKRFANNKYQKNWLSADTVTVGIGQGFNDYTPLQMAVATSILANNGLYYKPHFIKRILSGRNMQVVYNYISDNNAHRIGINISKSAYASIKQAMQLVVTQGTANNIANGLQYEMAAKTGTAQVVATKQNSKEAKFTGHKYHDHAWIIAFAPVWHPQIVLAVIVENAGFGRANAAPIARKLFDNYFLQESKQTTLKHL